MIKGKVLVLRIAFIIALALACLFMTACLSREARAQRQFNESSRDIPAAIEFYYENEVFFELLLEAKVRLQEHIELSDSQTHVMPPTIDFMVHQGTLRVSAHAMSYSGIVRPGGHNDLFTPDELQLIETTLMSRIVPRSSWSEGIVARVSTERISVMFTTSVSFGSPVMSADEWGDPFRYSFAVELNESWSFYIGTAFLR